MSFPPPAGAGERNTATSFNGNVKPSAWTYEDRRKLKSVHSQQSDYHAKGYKVRKETSDGKEERHEKLQRCRTDTPVTMLQAFLKTAQKL